jgi:hypothetical protein
VAKAEIKIRNLLHHDLLIHEDDACRFRAGLLRRWVAKQ